MRTEPPIALKLSRTKQICFALLVIVGFFALLETGLALVGFKPQTDSEDPYVGFVPHIRLFEPGGKGSERRWVTAANKLRFFNKQEFLANKPAGGYRVFCLGGSTTYGRPYDDRSSFCGWLRAFLSAAAPETQWEVINAGGISYASYRIAALMDELIEYQPDLFILYTGHNEFLERRTYKTLLERSAWINRLGAALSHTRVYTLLQGLLQIKRVSERGSPEQGYRLRGEVEALLDTSIGPAAYVRDDDLQKQVIEHFTFNLQRISERARSSGAKLVAVTPAANLRSCSPFKSDYDPGIGPIRAVALDQLVEQARQQLGTGQPAAALETITPVLSASPRHAGAQYIAGQILYKLGEFDAAAAAFERARDEDICPLRALSPIVQAVRDFATASAIPLLDFADLVDRRSEVLTGQPVAGEELFLDHVHPTVEGHRMLALALIETLNANQSLPTPIKLSEDQLTTVTSAVEASLDRATQARSLKNLAKLMSWAGKSDEAGRLSEQALDLGGEDAEVLFILGGLATERQQWPKAEQYYRRALELEPGYPKALNNMGLVLARQQRYEEAIEYYQRALAIKPDHANAHYNIGNAYRRLGRFAQAIDHYQQAIALQPDDIDARFNLARSLEDSGQTQAAVDGYRELLEHAPDDVEAERRLNRLLGAARGAGSGPAEH